jgi:hypothetical protein
MEYHPLCALPPSWTSSTLSIPPCQIFLVGCRVIIHWLAADLRYIFIILALLHSTSKGHCVIYCQLFSSSPIISQTEATSPHALHPPHATSQMALLPRTSTFGSCLPFKFRPLKAKSPFTLYFWRVLFLNPKTCQPTVALPNQTMGTWHWIIEGHGAMRCGLHWSTHGGRGQSRLEVGRPQLMLFVVYFVLSRTRLLATNDTFFVESQYQIGQNGRFFARS